MKLGIMQPYFFPYAPYFQLINAVDSFIIYDDVKFIKRGWINRNKILVHGAAKLITIPCIKPSQNKLINEVEMGLYPKERMKLLKTIYKSYKKAPFFDNIFQIIERILNSEIRFISELAVKSINEVCKYIGIDTEIISTSSIFSNRELNKADRLIDICRKMKCDDYINPIGGTQIYSKLYFKERGINLYFLKPSDIQYKQFGKEFVPWLSIIDMMMFNDQSAIQDMLGDYALI